MVTWPSSPLCILSSRPSMPRQDYCGETHGKRLARVEMFQELAHLQRLAGPRDPNAWAVGLAGTEAGEYGCVRWLMHYPSDRMFFIDNHVDGRVSCVKKKAADIDTFQGDIEEALELFADELVGLLHLDFTGYFNDKTRSCLRLARRFIIPGGFVVFTFYRGRETDHLPGWSLVKQFQDELGAYKNQGMTELDVKRFAAYTEWAMEELNADGPEFFKPVYSIRWDSGLSPMGAICFMRMPGGVRSKEILEHVNSRSSMPAIPDSGQLIRLRITALRLLHEGWDSEKVADILNVKHGTIAAWLAHETRGTYG